MRILQVLPCFDRGGVEAATMLLSKTLIEKGHESFVAAAPGAFVAPYEKCGGHFIPLSLNSKNPFTIALNARRLAHIIKTYQIDLVHARSRAPAYSAYFAAKATKTPFLTTFHATYNFHNNLKKAYNSIMVKGDAVVAISKFIENHILQNYQNELNNHPIHLIPEGVDLKVFNPQTLDNLNVKHNLRTKLALKDQDLILLMPARLTRWKGQEPVLKAFAKVAAEFPATHLVFLGTAQGRNDYLTDLHKIIDEEALTTRVHFLDHTDAFAEMLAGSDVILHASTDAEAFGRVIIEAMAMQKPMIAGNLGAPTELIEDGKTGFLHKAGDDADLAKILQKVLNLTPNQREKIGQQARLFVEKNYDLEKVLNLQLNLYQDLIQQHIKKAP